MTIGFVGPCFFVVPRCCAFISTDGEAPARPAPRRGPGREDPGAGAPRYSRIRGWACESSRAAGSKAAAQGRPRAGRRAGTMAGHRRPVASHARPRTRGKPSRRDTWSPRGGNGSDLECGTRTGTNGLDSCRTFTDRGGAPVTPASEESGARGQTGRTHESENDIRGGRGGTKERRKRNSGLVVLVLQKRGARHRPRDEQIHSPQWQRYLMADPSTPSPSPALTAAAGHHRQRPERPPAPGSAR